MIASSSETTNAGEARTTVRRAAIVLLPAVLVFAFHARWIAGHFSTDGYLCDSGWLAFLFERADPALRNPRAVVGQACDGVNAPTFLAHHLSTHLFLFGAPFALAGLPGTTILAIHQGLFFALLCAAFVWVAATVPAGRRGAPGILAVALIAGATANVVFQAAAYPHYEIALTCLSALGIAAWFTNHRRVFFGCLLWLLLVREDGGLFAAVVCLSCLTVATRGEGGVVRRSTLAMLAAGSLAASAAAFAIKTIWFPGFAAFARNFAGESWNHVTLSFAAERAWMTLTNWNIGPVLIGSLALARFDCRYLTGVVLLSPLLLVHMLSVREEHGRFTLYYALPIVLAVLLWLVVLAVRLGRRQATRVETLLVMCAALILTTPFQAIVGTPQQQWIVVRQVYERRVADLAAMERFSRSVRTSDAGLTSSASRHCASTGIAAVIPDDLTPEEVVSPDSTIAGCRTLLLLRRDLHYQQLSDAAARLGFRNVLERENAELWVRAE